MSSTNLALVPLASFVAETITHPIDFVKTRQQILIKSTQSQTCQTVVPSLRFFSLARSIYHNEGINPFYRGLPPAVLRHWVYSTLRIGIYENLRSRDDSFLRKVQVSLIAGGAGQMVATPTDVIKVRLQTTSSWSSTEALAGGTKQQQSNKQLIQQVIKQIYSESLSGTKSTYGGFFVGWKPNVLRAMLANLGELTAYDAGKCWIQKTINSQSQNQNQIDNESAVLVFLAACHSGFWGSLLSTPADVVKSRMMMSHASNSTDKNLNNIKQQYATVTSTIINTYKESDYKFKPSIFWRGFFATWARLGPWQLAFWLTYETSRKWSGYGGFS